MFLYISPPWFPTSSCPADHPFNPSFNISPCQLIDRAPPHGIDSPYKPPSINKAIFTCGLTFSSTRLLFLLRSPVLLCHVPSLKLSVSPGRYILPHSKSLFPLTIFHPSNHHHRDIIHTTLYMGNLDVH